MAGFLSTLDVQPQSRLRYGRDLLALATRSNLPVAVLKMFLQGQAVLGVGTPIAQAEPASWEQVATLMRRAPEKESIAIFLAWKTASRWGDILNLRRANFVLLDSAEVVIRWAVTKTTRSRQSFHPQEFTQILHRESLEPVVAVVKRLGETEPITTWSTDKLVQHMRKSPQTAALTAHSLKCGAVMQLVRHALAGKLEPRLVPLLAKHRDRLHDFPESTLRYVADPVAVARLMRSGEATRLL